MTSSSHAKPISWPPSQYREGADGNWSTFNLRVGNPPQIVRILPSTAGGDTWVVGTGGCPTNEAGLGGSSVRTCQDSRGGTFNSSLSSSWNGTGIYTVGIEANLGYADSAAYGFDTVGLDLNNDTGAPTLDGQIVGAFDNDDFYLGLFGLSHEPTNFTNFTTPHPSFLASLKNQSLIPSLAYGYTAGAHYQSKGGAFGSLTFGGYDASRIVPNNVTFLLAEDISRDLVVNVRSVIANYKNGTATTLLSPPSSLLAFIDSTQPFMYLPEDLCQMFQNSFHLSWNATHQMYFVDDKAHDLLLNSNPNITFQLADTQNAEATIDITLPYASFDLIMEYPMLPETTRYFPLTKGANDTQYTLGRSFLQEAYLVTNYENSSFSIFQTENEAGQKPQIIAIPSANTPVEGAQRHLSLGTKLGVGFGIAAFGILIILAILLIFKRHRKSLKTVESQQIAKMTFPADNIGLREIGTNSRFDHHQELPEDSKVELLDSTRPSGSGKDVSELSQSSEISVAASSSIHELMTHRGSPRLVPTPCDQIKQSEDKVSVIVTTNLTQQNVRKLQTSRFEPRVETTICSTKSDFGNLNRSLPPTPISESPQSSPSATVFEIQSPTAYVLESTYTRPGPGPWSLGNRALSMVSTAMDKEIAVPPECKLSEEGVKEIPKVGLSRS